MSDIRTSRRFPVHLPVKVLGEQETPVGNTANISAAGAYLWVEGGLQIGSTIEFEITIPAESIGAVVDVPLHCQGRVVRCDTNQEIGRTGIACVIEQYEFVRSTDVGGK